MAKEWDRQNKETTKAFSAFCAYLKQSPAERSLHSAYESYSGKKGKEREGKGRGVPSFFNKWSQVNNWVDRVRSYESHCLSEQLDAISEKKKQVNIKVWDLLDRLVQKQVGAVESMDLDQATRLMNSLEKMTRLFEDGTKSNTGPSKVTAGTGYDDEWLGGDEPE